MKAVIQIVNKASVVVEGKTVGKIEKGLFVLLGVKKGDTTEDCEKLASKVAKMRIFSVDDKMTNSVIDENGKILLVSNFTLYANCKKGNRPDFLNSAGSTEAEPLYNHFKEALLNNGVSGCETGVFGADMTISAECSGPVTVVLDSDDLK